MRLAEELGSADAACHHAELQEREALAKARASLVAAFHRSRKHKIPALIAPWTTPGAISWALVSPNHRGYTPRMCCASCRKVRAVMHEEAALQQRERRCSELLERFERRELETAASATTTRQTEGICIGLSTVTSLPQSESTANAELSEMRQNLARIATRADVRVAEARIRLEAAEAKACAVEQRCANLQLELQDAETFRRRTEDRLQTAHVELEAQAREKVQLRDRATVAQTRAESLAAQHRQIVRCSQSGWAVSRRE